MGFYGIAIGIFIYSLYVAKQTSFGIPYLSPIPKVNNRSMTNSIFENPIWKKNTEEPKISRNWKIKKNTR